jgi:hypothetical protein
VIKVNSSWKEVSSKEDALYVKFPYLVAETGRVLHLADLFFSQCGYLGNVEVRLAVDNIFKEKLIFTHPDETGSEAATDNQTSASETFLVNEIKTNLVAIVSNLMKSILWVFNYDIASLGAIKERVRKTLSVNHLIGNT